MLVLHKISIADMCSLDIAFNFNYCYQEYVAKLSNSGIMFIKESSNGSSTLEYLDLLFQSKTLLC